MSGESYIICPAPLKLKRSAFHDIEKQLLPLPVEDRNSSKTDQEEVPIKLAEIQSSSPLAASPPQRGLPPHPRLQSSHLYTTKRTINKPLPPSPQSAPALLPVRRIQLLLQEQRLLSEENDNSKNINRHFHQMFEACDAYEKRLTLALKEVQEFNFITRGK